MSEKKYELVMNDNILHYCGHILYRIRALRDFGNVKAGELGGYVEDYYNLSHEGNCWIYGDAKVFDHAIVCDNAKILNSAIIFDHVKVCGTADVYGNSKIFDRAILCSDADISSNNDYLFIRGLGSENRSTTAFRLSDGGVYVNCGCYHGTLDAFEMRVNDTHGDSIYGKEYKTLIQVIKIHFELI